MSKVQTAAAQAEFLARERERFTAQFPPQAANEAPFPTFTWNQLERQLMDLAENRAMAGFLRSALALSAGQADQLPAELLLREILVLAAMVQEENSPFWSHDVEGSSMT